MAAVALHRRETRASQMAAAVIIGVGKVIGFVRRRSPVLPGLGGAAAVSYGIAGYDWRAGLIAGGLFLLLMDHQIPLGPRGGAS
jgi:hypothetical protein